MTVRALNVVFSILAVALLLAPAHAQRQAKTGKVCGNPNLPCKNSSSFKAYELPFDTGHKVGVMNSETFYAVILESRKIKPTENCAEAFSEKRRRDVQKMFPSNKVFVLKCFEPGLNYYTNVANDVGFLGIFAGRTKVESTAFLKTVQSKFPGASLRQMQAGINGT